MEERNDLEKKASILIVEDQLNNLKVISELLSKKYKLYTANDGEKALKLLERILPDIILLDIMMPKMDGLEVCEKLKENPITKDIPVIFLTAKNTTEDIIQGFSKGAVDYISKPFNSKEVLVRVENHLQLKQAKEELKQANSGLEALNKEKDKFFSIISHDLKNPMGAISGLSQMLIRNIERNNLEGMNQVNVLSILNLINQGAETTHKLLENLLTWSRVQTGKIQIKKESFPLNGLFIYVVEFCQTLATNKNIKIINEINEDIMVFADMDMIHTVMRNLVTNAIKFTNKDGTVKIKGNVQKDIVIISVIDTGVGMSQDTIDKLFNISEKVATKGTEKEEGTGLGLLISQEFVEKHGGKIRIESKIGEGSNFSFTLPIGDSYEK